MFASHVMGIVSYDVSSLVYLVQGFGQQIDVITSQTKFGLPMLLAALTVCSLG